MLRATTFALIVALCASHHLQTRAAAGLRVAIVVSNMQEALASKSSSDESTTSPTSSDGGTTADGQACATDGSDYSYTESVSSDGLTRTIVTTYCPNHPVKQLNPNYAIKQTSTITVPAQPQYVGEGTADLTAQGGSVGVLYNGAMLFSPYGGDKYGTVTEYANSAAAMEGDTFDLCGCHASSTTAASYHCHVAPTCLLQQLGNDHASHSPQVGWAADGFPVYGPRGPGGITMQTCTQTGGTYGSDVCAGDDGGYYASLAGVDEFVFRYYILDGTYNDGTTCTNPNSPNPGAEYYPSTPTRYHGCCPTDAACSYGFLPSCSDYSTAVDGYSSGYDAAAAVQHASGLQLNCDACWASGESGAVPAACSSSSRRLGKAPRHP